MRFVLLGEEICVCPCGPGSPTSTVAGGPGLVPGAVARGRGRVACTGDAARHVHTTRDDNAMEHGRWRVVGDEAFGEARMYVSRRGSDPGPADLSQVRAGLFFILTKKLIILRIYQSSAA